MKPHAQTNDALYHQRSTALTCYDVFLLPRCRPGGQHTAQDAVTYDHGSNDTPFLTSVIDTLSVSPGSAKSQNMIRSPSARHTPCGKAHGVSRWGWCYCLIGRKEECVAAHLPIVHDPRAVHSQLTANMEI